MGKRLGQHFLKNIHILKEIASTTKIKDGYTIIEIGPGHGELTKNILSECGSTCAFIAIERDPVLADALARAPFFKDKNTRIVVGDALHELQKTIEKIHTPFVVVGNIPYYITGHLLRVLGSLKKKPERVVLVIQKEVAERIVATTPKMNLLAACTQIWAESKIIRTISKRDFSPIPKVDSALIELTVKGGDIPEYYYETVKTLFIHPRKTIINNLSTRIPRKNIESCLKELNISPTLRPQNLTIGDIIRITEKIK